MKELSRLRPNPGATRKRKRVGRGPGSGKGKTSGRGMKGQGSRTGKGKPAWFEGGQMPLQRRVPKRGFTPLVTKEFAVVNVGALEVFDDGARVDTGTLQAAGLVRKIGDGIKILGNGELTKKLDVVVHAYSSTARDKITKAGGTAGLVIEKVGGAVKGGGN
ncbi:MAG: 50S ribosomal protein L15 [Deltaproteobacteria bacterium]|nr:50S ribosomal protein L15 [Deltaproteobacteria bacterium]